MAIKLTNKRYIKGIDPSETPLGIYKDIDDKKVKIFDNTGAVEVINNYVNNGITGTVTVSTTIAQDATYSATTTVNDVVGKVIVDITTGALNSGAFFDVTVNNTFVKSNSIILLTHEGPTGAHKLITGINTVANGSFHITGWVGWTISSANDFKINFLVINPA